MKRTISTSKGEKVVSLESTGVCICLGGELCDEDGGISAESVKWRGANNVVVGDAQEAECSSWELGC